MPTAEEMVTGFLQETVKVRRPEQVPEHREPGTCENCCLAGLRLTHNLRGGKHSTADENREGKAVMV